MKAKPSGAVTSEGIRRDASSHVVRAVSRAKGLPLWGKIITIGFAVLYVVSPLDLAPLLEHDDVIVALISYWLNTRNRGEG